VAPPDRVITYGLDATPLLGRRTGIGRYVAEIADGVLAGLAANERLVVYAGTFRQNPLLGVSHEPLTRLAKDPRVSVRRQWTPLSAAHAVWNRADFPPLEWVTGRLDVFHGTNFRLPPLAKGRGVVTVHDLAFLTCPGSVPPEVGRRLENAVRAAVRRATPTARGSRSATGCASRSSSTSARRTRGRTSRASSTRSPRRADGPRCRTRSSSSATRASPTAPCWSGSSGSV
jgi:hypothetical protein